MLDRHRGLSLTSRESNYLHYACRAFSALYTFSEVTGRSVMRTPQASATAFATAAAVGVFATSPMAKLLYGPGPAGTFSITSVFSGGTTLSFGIFEMPELDGLTLPVCDSTPS